MKYSRLFGKTTKSVSKDITLASHTLLVQGGFIRESVAGRYFFLPLGMRVKNKLIEIIRQEMDAAGAQEMVTPILHPLELWQETNRDSAGNFGLMKVEDRRGATFALGGTAEEMFVDVVRSFQISYKDLPFNVYQFSQKFRDELRARGGLLRVREFTMKDAYSFDRDEKTFVKTYQTMSKTYSRIFTRLGLDTDIVPADNGYIGGEYCHEFVAECEVGESRYLVSKDRKYIAHEDVAEITKDHKNPKEDLKPLKTIDQPEWVHTMEDNVKHYKQPAWRFLKNVVYKNISTGDIVIAVIRGDLEVNKTKLEKLIGAIEQLDEATSEDMAQIGTKPGYVHAWGHSFVSNSKTKKKSSHPQVIYVADDSLATVTNFIGGQKQETSDTTHVNYGRDFRHELEGDITLAKPGDVPVDSQSPLQEKRGVEVGNIFQLGLHYSTKMEKATYTDNDGQEKPYYMGCYGIGVGRTLQTVAQLHRDDRGIIWPRSIAPYTVYLIDIGGHQADVSKKAQQIYQSLQKAGIDVLWDDRDSASPGEKFADADLIGCPYRVVVSKKTGNKIEVKLRDKKEVRLVSLDDLIVELTQL